MARASMSPLSIVLWAVFFFSANVLAVAAVLGVDLGTEYIKASLVKPGIPLEIVLTKDSRRKETSAVAFKPPRNGPKAGEYPERLYGSDAMALSARFPGDIYPNLKAILGLPVDSAAVQEYATRHPALQLERHQLRDTAMFKSKGAFTPDEEAWMVEELLAMELQSIQHNAEALAGPDTSVRSVVLTVPPFYSIEEKRAVELAAELAGLRVLSLISDGLAVGLNYATSRSFPNVNEKGKPEHHMVFDMGAGSTKATIMRFQSRSVKDVGKYNKTIQEVEVLGSGWDRTLGGDSLNALIVDDMIAQFVESPAAKKISTTTENVMAHGRAVAKLSKEAERLRHILSANTKTQANFEGLYEDVDFKYKISRADFEKLSERHATRVGAVMQSALDMAGLQAENLDSVILHGGASRTPFVQKELEQVFGSGDKLRSNVNSDEAAVFGAGFRAAELSPSFRVKEIRISEGSVYPAGMQWTNAKTQKEQHQRLWTSTSPLGAAPKEVTFTNLDDFTVNFYQQITQEGPSSEYVERPTKALVTKNLTATVATLKEIYSCEAGDIQFKVGLRLSKEDGEVEVTQASVQCEADEPEKEGIMDGVKNLFGFGKKEQQPLEGSQDASDDEVSGASDPTDSSATSSSEADSTTTSASTPLKTEADAKPTTGSKSSMKQLVVIPVEYELKTAGVPQLSKSDLTSLKDRLKAFEASDRSRRLREEALNQLESYTYKIRDLLDGETFVAASTEDERRSLEAKNSEVSDWLYGDGADASQKDLKARLKELQDIIIPIQTRIEESQKRPELISGLKEALDKAVEFTSPLRAKISEDEALRAAQSGTSSTSSKSSSTVTASPSPGDFDGLEDDEATTKSPEVENLAKDPVPVSPLYTNEDLQELEGLSAELSAWLKDMEAKQDQLTATDDPVLRVKDLEEKQAKLQKAHMDLALKGVQNFEKRHKRGSNKSAKPKKPKTTKTESAPGGEQTIRLETQEEIEEFMRRYQAEEAEKQGGSTGGAGGGGDGTEPTHDEL